MNNKWKHSNLACAAVFAGMLLFLLLQFSHVMVYFDDYGYYSLSYGMETAAGGHTYTFSQLWSFLKAHYFDVNGRIPGYVLWLSLYCIGGLPLVQISAAGIVTLILVLLWKFIGQKEHPIGAAILVCAFYGLFSINLQRQGTYWFAAFFQYVAPVAPLIGFLILYFKGRATGFSWKQQLALLGLVVLSAYSQEQLSVTVTFMMCLLVLFELVDKRLKPYHGLWVLVAAACVAALLLSPSSQDRAAGSGYTFMEQLVYSTYRTITSFFAADLQLLIVLLYLAVLGFSVSMYVSDKGFLKFLDVCSGLLSVGSIGLYCCAPALEALGALTLNRYYLVIAVGVPAVSLVAIQVMRYYWKSGSSARLLLFMTAVGSVGCLCMVPEVPARLLIPSWLLLFPLLADGLFLSAAGIQKHSAGLAKPYLALMCSLIALCSASNALWIYNGYADNLEAYEYNNAQLTAAAQLEADGVAVEKLYLRTMPNPDCAAALPYHAEVTYMKHWMKYFYEFETVPDLYYSAQGTELEESDYLDQGNGVYLSSEDSLGDD